MEQLFVGTSGWSYDNWVGDFYPEKTEKTDMLEYYMEEFNSVEINATFYRLPFENMIEGWKSKAPEGFQYSAKAPRQVTHYNKLDADEEFVDEFSDRLEDLDNSLGPVLWQLPPSLEKNMDRLKEFLEMIDTGRSHAIEFRNKTWLDEEVYSELESSNVSVVSVSSEDMPAEFHDRGDFVYYRFHGLADGHNYNYSKKELDAWAEQCADVLDDGKIAYAYFNNTTGGYAPMNAKLFRDMVERKEG